MVTARAAAIARGLSIVFVGSVLAQGSIEPTGPLVGAVTADSARIWVHAAEGAKVEVRYGLADAEPAARVAFEPIDKPDAAIPGRSALATLTGLKAATAYRFAVSVDGKTSPELAGSFRTAPAGPARFRVGVTSCMKIGQPQASWRLFLSQQPDLHLTLGDTHYADTTDPGVQWQHHLRYRREPDFARVLRHVPTYAMWDDHDYGPNDSDGTARGKERSLISWNRVWANPPAGADGRPGAFFRFGWGEVDFFMVDGRYHRSPNKAPDDDKKRMLGDAQFAWLIDGLKASRAKFKVIASGSTLHLRGRVAHLHLRAPPALRRPTRAQDLGRAVFLGRHPPVAGWGAPRVRAGRLSAGGGDLLGCCRQQNAQLRDRGFRYGRGRPDGSGTRRVRRRPGAPRQVLAALNPQR